MSKNDHTDGETALNGSAQDTGVSEEPAGECEDCGDTVTVSEAKTESFPGPEGRIVLLFCPGCRDSRKRLRDKRGY